MAKVSTEFIRDNPRSSDNEIVATGGIMNYRTASVAIGILSLLANAATAQSYAFHELYTLGTTHGPGFNGFPFAVGPGGEVVGYIGHAADTGSYPTIWNPANPNGIDLEPVDSGGFAYETDGVHQVGEIGGRDINGVFYDHATIWSGQPGTAVNLNPTPFVNGVPVPWVDSFAEAVSSSQQVGFGCPNGCSSGNPLYALLWSGTKESFVNLNPVGFQASIA